MQVAFIKITKDMRMLAKIEREKSRYIYGDNYGDKIATVQFKFYKTFLKYLVKFMDINKVSL